jgi:hypothetical protein
LAFRRHRAPRNLVTHAIEEVLVIERQSLGPGDLSHIPRGLLLVTDATNCDESIGVIGVLGFGAQGERWTMIEDEEA